MKEFKFTIKNKKTDKVIIEERITVECTEEEIITDTDINKSIRDAVNEYEKTLISKYFKIEKEEL